MLLTELANEPSLREIIFAIIVFIIRIIEKRSMKRKFEREHRDLIERNKRQAEVLKSFTN